jgi:hypothetical protein
MQLAMRAMVSTMRKLHENAKLGEGLRPELMSLYERLSKDPYSEQFIRKDGMVQSGPDPNKVTGLTREAESETHATLALLGK